MDRDTENALTVGIPSLIQYDCACQKIQFVDESRIQHITQEIMWSRERRKVYRELPYQSDAQHLKNVPGAGQPKRADIFSRGPNGGNPTDIIEIKYLYQEGAPVQRIVNDIVRLYTMNGPTHNCYFLFCGRKSDLDYALFTQTGYTGNGVVHPLKEIFPTNKDNFQAINIENCFNAEGNENRYWRNLFHIASNAFHRKTIPNRIGVTLRDHASVNDNFDCYLWRVHGVRGDNNYGSIIITNKNI